jgi:lipopolysaccharide transport system ATP-binding protein
LTEGEKLKTVDDCVIRVEELSKKYLIGHQQRDRHPTFKDLLTNSARSLGNALRKPAAQLRTRSTEELWALKNVSFQVHEGERVGIIGRNGAGKSTLLKILSRITEPTEGRIALQGRVGSLLEVGTGFHPELTGRENIYLNGAILGMSKSEIERKFDEIVAFSEVEKFLDTPVKRYSSGMYVRLAFAVAAHLETEILIVDEVLAVGDIQFQKKCLEKMGNVTKEGRTVLFVSHNMQAVSVLCQSAILLENGTIAAQGPSLQVVEQYLSSGGSQVPAEALWSFKEAPGASPAKLRSVSVLNDKNEVSSDLWMNKPITLKAQLWILCRTEELVHVSFHLYNKRGSLLFAAGNFHDASWRDTQHKPGLYSCSCTIPENLLNEGKHYVNVYLSQGSSCILELPEIVSFNVHDPGDSRFGWTGTWSGLIRPILPWRGERIGDLP